MQLRNKKTERASPNRVRPDRTDRTHSAVIRPQQSHRKPIRALCIAQNAPQPRGTTMKRQLLAAALSMGLGRTADLVRLQRIHAARPPAASLALARGFLGR